MKLVRWGESGAEKPGLVDRDGAIRDLSGVIRDIAGPTLAADSLATLRLIDPATPPTVLLLPRRTVGAGELQREVASRQVRREVALVARDEFGGGCD